MAAHTISVLPTPVDNTAETKYVNGDKRYIKIQNPGMAVGLTRTPQKTRVREKQSWAMFPPVSACSIPAITMELNVELNMRKIRISKNMVPLRSVTESVGIAFL